jgi:transcriptional regulator GlxA family with amidase domain
LKTCNVGILIFDNVEVLDFSGPFEVFNVANEINTERLFKVFNIAETEDIIMAKFDYKVKPDYSINDHPEIDILVIPGGEGRKIQMNNPVITGWVKKEFDSIELLLTVCTGVFIAGKSGVLNVKQATTHHASFNEFEKTFPHIELVKNVKYVDSGKIITAGGISAGINASLYIIDKLIGNDHGKKTAEHMEYDCK